MLCKLGDLTVDTSTYIKTGRGFAHVNSEHGWEEGGDRRITKVAGCYVFENPFPGQTSRNTYLFLSASTTNQSRISLKPSLGNQFLY